MILATLILGHLVALALGAVFMRWHLLGRAEQVRGLAAVLEVRELFIEGREDQLRRGVILGTPEVDPVDVDPPVGRPYIARHSVTPDDRPVPPPPSLASATVREAGPLLDEARAQRERERREFIELMTAAGSWPYVHTAVAR